LLWVVRDDVAIQLDAIAGLALRNVVGDLGNIAAATLDPHSGELTLQTDAGTWRFDRDAKASNSLVRSFVGAVDSDASFRIGVPLALVPTLEVTSQEATPLAGVRISLRFSAQCDGFACPLTSDYLGTLRLSATVGHRSVVDRFVVSAAGDNATGVIEREQEGSDTGLRLELADSYGQRSGSLIVELDEARHAGDRPRPKANAPPSVAITSPANNTILVAPAMIVVNASAADTDGTVVKVEFFRSGTLASTDTTSPWSATLSNVGVGTYTLTAKATDNAGAATTSAPISVQVKANVAPTVTLTSPAANATFTAPATITLSATATDSDGTISKVEFFRGGTTKIATDTPRLTHTAGPMWRRGNYSLTATATDDKSAVTTSSIINISVNAPPTVALTSPAAGAVFVAPASIVLTATAADADGTIAKVEFYEGATKLFTDTAAPYTYTRTNAAAGTYSYTAVATDNKGAVATSSLRSVTVNVNQLPTVTITAPVANATFVSPASITITATATDSDGTIAKVEFYRDGVLLGADTISPYAYTWTNAPVGSYVLTARATDDKVARRRQCRSRSGSIPTSCQPSHLPRRWLDPSSTCRRR
jgi:hypothetical protein